MIPEILIVSTGASFISTMLDGKQPHKKSERKTWSHLLLGKYFSFVEGIHGFDGTSMDPYGYKREGYSPEMRTVFMAAGPSFKKGHKHDVILSEKRKNAESAINVFICQQQWIRLEDEYQLFCYSLGLKESPHNGTWSRVKGMLADGGKHHQLYQINAH